ncbi:ethanolamine utilization protein EutA [Caldalkalibacillus uzonensis]|uniref:Ethanolamine utilization protein EutA n=2 Tax=Caldalkalibacillus uzonensis TaxID=353224 RepID=A0ABU0CRN0_9BACI|nr:ethanolamine utilization protein EutA [Caldalkalibacillus uzonensis]
MMEERFTDEEVLLSAGIDIGTSTTKIVISRLKPTNTAGTSHVPRIEIVDKSILYKSPIYRTPLRSKTIIDMEAVLDILQQEYGRAGIKPEEIKTGAVIITGETATKRNAQEMLHLLSEKAGQFVVATAGPDLEGILAAKGSGAYQYAQSTGKVVANIDIGGGTANIAVYRGKQFQGTCTLHIGGRLIEFESDKITHISAPVQEMIDRNKWTLAVGQTFSKAAIRRVAREMVSTLVSILQGRVEDKDRILLLGHPPDWQVDIEAIMFSGGVSECLYRLEEDGPGATPIPYQDMGATLAEEIKASESLKQWEWIPPQETVRATVLGAGIETTEISGSTIQVDDSRLPLKNIPVFHVDLAYNLQEGEVKIRQAVERAIQIYDSNLEGQNFALYLTQLPVLTYSQVQQLAQWIVKAYQLQPNQHEPMIVIVDGDFAKVVGQTMKMIHNKRDVVCIDQIRVEHGDYVDIGRKLRSDVVPVVVKTLAFQA